MCHSDIPPKQPTPDAARREVEIALPTGETMPALHFATDAGTPPVLIIADMLGVSPFYEHLAALVAEAGFQALVPDVFFRQGPLAEPGSEAAVARRAKLDERQSVEDMRAAVGWLSERSGGAAVGAIGFCMGGTFALDLASTQGRLVTVAYYGFPEPPAWVVAPPERPIDLVDSLSGPVLAFWGELDETVGLAAVRRYAERAAAANPRYAHEILPGLGHGFLGTSDLADPTDTGGATWARTIAHLRAHLGVRQSGREQRR
ncbi:dienelactone hydrolase family protein [Streptomyces blattellae]|uniref:dienelactone hydrolase family protein n=1 Tax=Streptomyces blattellae TaxID=2569855 RepID=UPI0012B7CA4A|nr:dienelactone hydrolase family protein [Streptomyces blattellae]